MNSQTTQQEDKGGDRRGVEFVKESVYNQDVRRVDREGNRVKSIVRGKGRFMLFKIALYIGIMAVGVFFSRNGKIPQKVFKEIDRIQMVCLLFLLFVMGVSVGVNKQVMQSFPKLGLQSVIFSVFTISFSVLFVFLFQRVFEMIVKKGGR